MSTEYVENTGMNSEFLKLKTPAFVINIETNLLILVFFSFFEYFLQCINVENVIVKKKKSICFRNFSLLSNHKKVIKTYR